MGRYILRRLLWLIPIVFLVIVLVFTILYFTPGDPARVALGQAASQEAVDLWNHQQGLDLPYFPRLFRYIGNLFKGDMGSSYYTNVPVFPQIVTRFPYTARIALLGTVFSVVLGLLLGILAATHQNTWLDSATMALSMFFASMPNFWFALILVMIFSINLGWLPAVGYESWKCYVMPTIAIGLQGAAMIARQTRSSMLEVLRSDHVTTARAKGQRESNTIFNHVLRNALIPVITVTGSIFAALLGGSLILEQIYSIPGIGLYLFTGIATGDVPIVMGCVIVIAVTHYVIMLLCDLLYMAVDPRLRTAMLLPRGKKSSRKKAVAA